MSGVLTAPDPAAARGWSAQLRLQYQVIDSRTRLVARSHRGPLLVQRVFHPENAAADAAWSEPCHTYIIHPPGGIVSGDELALDVELAPRSHALLTTPAAGKFYRRGGQRIARLSQTFKVSGAALEWLPQENIFYPNAAAELSTVVRLQQDARFIGWEIGCMGLPVNDATLADGAVRQCIELWRDDRLLLMERIRIERSSLASRWGLAGQSSLGSWIATGAGERELALARQLAERADCRELMLACTLIDGVLICRALASRADQLRQIFIELWRATRPLLLGRAAVAPRIWAT